MIREPLLLVAQSDQAELLDLVREIHAALREPPPLLDRNGAARLLGISLPQLDRLRKEPSFPSLKVGTQPRFDASDLKRWAGQARWNEMNHQRAMNLLRGSPECEAATVVDGHRSKQR